LKTGSTGCPQCGQRCNVADGVIDLLGTSEFFWSEVPISEMRELIDLAETQGVSAAVLWLANRYPDLAQYLISKTRIDWLFHCYAPEATEACLDLGSGWGALSILLSDFYREVWSLESVRERVEFQKVRLEEDGIDNVRLLRANMLDLPFEDESFDLVVLNGALEWAAAMEPSGNPRDIQVEFLSGIRRILRPGGTLYVGIENRFGWNYFVGDRDHSGLRFTSLLPRWTADWVVRLSARHRKDLSPEKRAWDSVNWRAYRTWTYSSAGYRRLLGEAGFTDAEVCWAWPSYSFPRYSGRLSEKRPFRLFLSTHFAQRVQVRGDLKSKLLWWVTNIPFLTSLLRRTNPSFLLYAHKGSALRTLREGILESQGATEEEYFHKGGGIRSGNAYVLPGADGRGSAVFKYPRFVQLAESFEQQEQRFAEMNDLPVERLQVNSLPIFREPFVHGRPFQIYTAADNRMALDWLLKLQAATRGEPVPADHLAQQAADVRKNALDVLPTDLQAEVNRCCSDAVMINRGLPSVLEHGDFTAANIWFNDRDRLYVFDWEFSEANGSTLFDLSYFLVSNAYRGTNPDGALTATLSGEGPYAAIWNTVVAEFCRASGVHADVVEAYLPFSILRLLVRYRSQAAYNFHLFRRLFALLALRNRAET
jgi:SAM-dependent methyltransferase